MEASPSQTTPSTSIRAPVSPTVTSSSTSASTTQATSTSSSPTTTTSTTVSPQTMEPHGRPRLKSTRRPLTRQYFHGAPQVERASWTSYGMAPHTTTGKTRLITIPCQQHGTSTSPRTCKPQQTPPTLHKSPPHQSSTTEEYAKAESAVPATVTYTTILE